MKKREKPPPKALLERLKRHAGEGISPYLSDRAFWIEPEPSSA